MLEQYSYIRKYNWEVYSFYNVKQSDRTRLLGTLKYLKFDSNIIDKIINNVKTVNNGFCYSDFDKQRSVIVLNKTSSSGEFINSFIHEINHLSSHIEEKFNIEPYSEEASYLIGNISQIMYTSYSNARL